MNMYKSFDILLLPTNDNETEQLDETKYEIAFENTDETSNNENNNTKRTKKLENIQTALKIINNNRCNKNLEVLDIGLQCLAASHLGDNRVLWKKPIDIASPIQQIRIGVDGVPIEVENDISINKKSGASTEITIPKEEDNKEIVKSHRYIKMVILSKEDLMRERYRKMQSIDYMKLNYKCKNCIIGFNYKLNLKDHIQRKHTPKPDSITCELCFQVNPTNSFHTHHLSHYRRYECLCCKKRFSVYSDALQHYRRQHGHRKNVYKCKFCNYSSGYKCKLKLHIQKFHYKFSYDECSETLTSEMSRKWHKMKDLSVSAEAIVSEIGFGWNGVQQQLNLPSPSTLPTAPSIPTPAAAPKPANPSTLPTAPSIPTPTAAPKPAK